MRGYPRGPMNEQDYKNLLKMDEFKGRAKAELIKLNNTPDVKATRAVSRIDPKDPNSDWITEEIDNPSPRWKTKGFKAKDAVLSLINTNEEEE